MGIDTPTDPSIIEAAESGLNDKLEEALKLAWRAEGLDKALSAKGNEKGAQMAKMAMAAILGEGMEADFGGQPNMPLVEKSTHLLSVLCDENEYDSGKGKSSDSKE